MITPMTTLPFRPLDWAATPKDLTVSAGVHNRQLSVYTSETVQRFVYGTRYTTWDGRVFKYSKVGFIGIAGNSAGVKNPSLLVANRVTGTTTIAAVVPTTAAGITSIVLGCTQGTLGNSYQETYTTRDGIIAENELVGGYIVFLDDPEQMNRMIIGNSALAAAGTSITIYFDAPLDAALASASATCMILANPYINVTRENQTWSSVIGVPARSGTTAALQNIWIQTWGILRVTPITESQAEACRRYIFDDQGAVKTSVTDYATKSQQLAGFIVEASQSTGNYECAPFIMLQISI